MARKVILHDENDEQIFPMTSTMVTTEASFTDFDDLANGGMNTYSGRYFVKDTKLLNAPFDGWYSLEVVPGSSEYMGEIYALSYWDNTKKYTSVNNGKIVGWKTVSTMSDSVILNWRADMDILKGQMVTFSSLGDFATGKLTNPIFKAKVAHNTGSAFPNASDSSEYWELVNPESYEIYAKSKMFYGLDARWYRSGDRVLLNVGGSFNADGINQIGSMTVIGDKIPSETFYTANYFPGSDYKQVVVAFLNFNTHSDWHGQFKFGSNDPSIYVSTWLGNSQMNKSDNGDTTPVEYYADPATRVWSSGVPTL